jgi:hypothetical protein
MENIFTASSMLFSSRNIFDQLSAILDYCGYACDVISRVTQLFTQICNGHTNISDYYAMVIMSPKLHFGHDNTTAGNGPPNTLWGKLRKAILSTFYNISQRNFGIVLIL